MPARWYSDRLLWFSFVYAASLGFLLWALSPTVFHVAEPWDSEYPLYTITMLIAALALGLVVSRRLALLFGYLGAWLGQVAALAVLPSFQKSWLLLGIVSTAIGSFLFPFGVALGLGIGLLIGWRRDA